MAQLTFTQFLTLDGVYQGPGGPDEDRSGGFEHGGWLVPFADDDMGRFVNEVFDRAGAFLFGRRTYDIFASYWPRVTDEDDPIASRLNHLPKYVVSRTLRHADWEGSTIVGGGDDAVAAEVARLKEEQPEGELQIHGSATLARSLLARDLIDVCHLLVYPVAVGQGQRLFQDLPLPTAFELADHRTTAAGVAIHSYRPAGRATFGTIGA
ncbi:dihydrofolate reductase family protein [Streptomyces sp. MUM 178J]|uniref:dihydrofolate reductase family protein n=1 Tax=Streptomyces sp. MUM 178J TaxID=2791991 RepID=UPI001F043C58|nr:dihydrofolate reductase family protein [Streptomyces sp. MUM 178J]WRQ80308.1 dihydrofolate reductase family protein [Streptomyces sp. MUM 178J]